MTKSNSKGRGRPRNTECENRGCKLKYPEGEVHGLAGRGKKKRFCGVCTICFKGEHFPFSNMPGGANCHAECYEKRYGEIDNARAITSLARGGY